MWLPTLRIPVFDSNSVRVQIGYLNIEEFNSAAFRPDRVVLDDVKGRLLTILFTTLRAKLKKAFTIFSLPQVIASASNDI